MTPPLPCMSPKQKASLFAALYGGFLPHRTARFPTFNTPPTPRPTTMKATATLITPPAPKPAVTVTIQVDRDDAIALQRALANTMVVDIPPPSRLIGSKHAQRARQFHDSVYAAPADAPGR